MSWRKIGLWAVLLDFVAFTAWVIYQYGYSGFFELHLTNAIGIQVFADLIIALTLVMVWMVRDARERGVSATPYVIATLCLGSIGPLLYLALRPEADSVAVMRHVAHAS